MTTAFQPGAVWLDTAGRPIQAHGGGVVWADGVAYWYGENKDADTVAQNVPFTGFRAYASTDLLSWTDAGVVLAPVTDDPDHDLHPRALPERPKVLYNARTRQYVLWAHIDRNPRHYARTGVAVSESPTGPFRYRGSFRPNGCDSRDMTVFQDEDGSAWLLYASQDNADLHVTRLTDDYLGVEPGYTILFPGAYREAPAVYKHDGVYYLVTSGCTGWFPNAAEYAVADAPTGPWRAMGNPCVGPRDRAARTFDSQVAFILPVPGHPGGAIAMADRWNPDNLRDSRHVWLPLSVTRGHLRIEWRDCWNWKDFPG